MLLKKIISGGQTGVDRGAIEAALELGFPYGGLIPKGRLAEDGIVPLKFTAMEESTRKDYLFRTEWNVVHSDATLILNYGRELSGGTKRTAEFCKKHNKPFRVEDLNAINETDRGLEVLSWLEAEFGMRSVVLNVAGPRESKCPGIQNDSCEMIARLLKEENEEHMDSEDATFMAEADFPAEGLGKGPIFVTDGIFLSESLLEEMKSNPSKFFESKGPLAGQTP